MSERVRTVSEELFEAFCAEHGLGCEPIPCVEGERTTDYWLRVGGHDVVVEVKQLDPTPKDDEHQQNIEAGIVKAHGDQPGRRIRRQIDSAKKQLKRQSKGEAPGLLVLYNNIPYQPTVTDPMFVLMAMYGQVEASIEIPASPREAPRWRGFRLGGGRRMTKDHNTSISALGMLQGEGSAKKRLTIYHNIFAANPFDPNWLRSDAVAHYTVKDPASGTFEEWQAC